MPGQSSTPYPLTSARGQTLTYGVIEKTEVASAARIYVQSFPWRVRRFFQKQDAAVAFYSDLFELMRLAHGETFFAARDQGQLIGFLILTLPENRLFQAMWREAFCLRLVRHAIGGYYGHSFSLLGVALRALAQSTTHPRTELLRAPHVSVVVVRAQDTGKGIGSSLIERARASCYGRYGRIWLYVEADNSEAVRLYQRLGFQILESDATQHTMIWNLPDRVAGIA